MIMPNFLVIGAAKSGTSSLYHYLMQHPSVYMSPLKETEFFIRALDRKLTVKGPGANQALNKGVHRIDDYSKLFDDVSSEVAIGEATPGYLYHPWVPESIKNYIPEAKLIAILRNPVDRAYSHFFHNIRRGVEPIADFQQAIIEEENRIRQDCGIGFHYINRGFYYIQLKRFFDTFDSSQIKVYLTEDLKNNSIKTLQDTFSFLGVDDTFIPDVSRKHNEYSIPKDRYLDSRFKPIKAILKPFIPEKLRKNIVTNLAPKNTNATKPRLSSEIRRELVEVYRQDILKLQDLIQRDLSKWLD